MRLQFNCKASKKLAKVIFYFIPGLVSIAGVSGQVNQYDVVRTPEVVAVNRALPKDILSSGQTMPAIFSAVPTDEEISRVHFFEEPLVPMEDPELEGENAALVYALAGFSQRKSPDDFTTVNTFLKEYPNSRWRGALLANLGIVYRRTGYYNEAMDAWQQSWELMKDKTEAKVSVLADRVVSELLSINSWVGRLEKMESLLKEIESRVIKGPAAERVVSICESVWTMKNKPGISFKCGPYALNKLFTIRDTTKAYHEKLMEVQSTSKGFSLVELERMAREIGLDYQMVFRQPGAEVIVNSVVHWKLGHYSALLKMENGHYKCEDATMGTVYGQQFWLTPSALDSSASGYFLVPQGPLPKGWRPVMMGEWSKVFGKGKEAPGGCQDCGPDGSQGGGGGGGSCGMANFNVHLAPVSLHIFDRPVFYTPPKGPAMLWDVYYHQREDFQPANFSYSNMGPKWTFEWLSFMQDDPNNPFANASVYMMGGGVKTFTQFDTVIQSYAPQLQTRDVLTRISPACYELRHPDGSKEVYSRPDGSTVKGRKIFLTQKIDVAGNKMTVMYDVSLRIKALQDAIGQVTTLEYKNASDIYKITKVTDPFGRSASFSYDNTGRLTKITDVIGIASSFQYDNSDFITQLTTPYGVTKFLKVEGPGNFRSVEIHYPLGEKEKVEFADNAPGIFNREPVAPKASIKVTNAHLDYRNTFFWDKKAMQEAPADYTKAKIYHWLHGSIANGNGEAAPILESIKDPLENRVWYNYPGQIDPIYTNQGMSARPSVIGRVLDDSSNQIRQFTYNALGHVTSSIDPSGRKLTYIYDSTNSIDLLEVRQTTNGANELLEKYTYNNQHLPLTATDASGQITKFTYNAAGQLLTGTNPKKEKTTLQYDGNGYLKSITGPIAGSKVNFTYDGFGRLRTITDPDGYTIKTDYDALDRPTLITYPDSSYEQIVYNRLDPVHSRDRLGRWSHTIYDSLDRATVIQDALGSITQLIWCTCGSLVEIIDPLKQITGFTRDLQGRITSKTYHDGTTNTYKYENTTSRLKEATDAKGQTTKYSYFIDDNLKQVDYLNARVATPSVAFSYDPNYDRIATIKDGTGTTAYSYNPVIPAPGAGLLAAIDGPLSNDVIAYTYDSLGRVSGRSINGVASSVVYDALGRVTSATNALGSFGYSYVNQTDRLSSISVPNGQHTFFGYYDNKGDQQLKQIWHKKSNGSTLSKFNYEYNDEGQITKWLQQAGDTSYYEFGYDFADQLISATRRNQNTGNILKRYAYQYDKAGNKTSEQVDNSVTSAVYNTVNQLTSQNNGGPMRLKGHVHKFSSVIVKNRTSSASAVANVDTANTFEAFIKVVSGPNNILITSTDYSGNGNSDTNNYNITVTPGINNTLAFDSNGNTISATNPAVAYDWDAADRLVKITKGANITEFVYDGLSRRVAEILNGTVIKRWLWCGTELCEERNANGGTVTKRFFPQGEQIGGLNYYFTRDHLGSVIEMTDSGGALKARYTYDPYGRRSNIAGNMNADFGFTGHYFHVAGNLYLTLYRAYDASLGRWLSKDPLEEEGGLNLYGYVNSNPMNKIDRFGLHENGLIPPWFRSFSKCKEDFNKAIEDVRRYLRCNSPIRGGFGFVGGHWDVLGVFTLEAIAFFGYNMDVGWNGGGIIGPATSPRSVNGAAALEFSYSQSEGGKFTKVGLFDFSVRRAGVGGFGTGEGSFGAFGYVERGHFFGGAGADFDFFRDSVECN